MKKLLFALLLLLGAVSFVPRAEAGQYVRVYNGRCVNYVPKAYYYGNGGYCAPRVRSTYYRPAARVYYSRPVRYYGGYNGGYNYCNRPVGYYSAGPRFAFSFGF